MFPGPSFRVWCKVVDLRLREQAGRPLADAPVGDGVLRCWWRAGVPARIVAGVLAFKMNQVPRVTFSRFYTDRRAEWIQERMIGRIRV